jgi:hypothetical protein
MVWIFVLLMWALCAFGGAKIMEGKGRSAGAGVALGLLFGLFGVLACACFSKTLNKKAEEAAYLRSILKD